MATDILAPGIAWYYSNPLPPRHTRQTIMHLRYWKFVSDNKLVVRHQAIIWTNVDSIPDDQDLQHCKVSPRNNELNMINKLSQIPQMITDFI